MCNNCFNNTISTTTTFTVEYKGCIIVVKNVPCYECQICGDIRFTDEVAGKLEMLVETTKKLLQEVSVIDYNKAA